MLRRALLRLRAAGGSAGALPAPAPAAAWGPAPTSLAARWLHAATPAAAHAHDALSSGKAPSAEPPDEGPGGGSFDKLADLYLGGMWAKMQSGLQGAAEHQGQRLDVQFGRDMGLRVALPDGGRIEVAKDPEREALVVRSTLHDTLGSDGALNEVPFKLQVDHTWETDGEELHQFLEDNLAKHLKVQLDLEPEAQTMYGPDPT
ncbi:tetratricopeptide repeat 9B [Micractinium conductrix]|uniref:Tetratricopeptide repeat 9B n=1 Tax=Micractinium conductrix TaxID=554055 RepID=A0A2P6V700_9CHLO|nr:tetratricopeptide repeat 9B [Micractinium conductrix]|eukprot:PSC69863.1 tetratricopeptide repeat 9B [Micractinium conductrix]